jgi:NAD(P)-dependent dehydrogenase (short-subunit alcohol dehydrogenase family)
VAVVLITGCSSGFGMATARQFARRGDRVFASMRNLAKADELREALGSSHVDVLELDVTQDASVRSAVAHVLAEAGRIDILVNNAGVGRYGTVERIPWDWARETFETNFWGAMRLTRAVLPVMREQQSGMIVNVTSVVARLPGMPVSSMYGASKHALSSLSESLALEVAQFGIRVVVIEPGWYKTQALDNALVVDDADSPYALLEAAALAADRASMAAAADPDEVATAIVAAAHNPGPLHVPVGDDADGAIAESAGLTFEEWTEVMASESG